MGRLRKFMRLKSDDKSLLIKGCYKSNLRIGAAIGDADQLEAHAWLESNGRVPIGGSGINRYTVLPILNQETQ